MTDQHALSVPVFVISDSLGKTAEHIVKAAAVQFPKVTLAIKKFPIVTTTSLLTGILHQAARAHAVVIYTFSNATLAHATAVFCAENGLASFDGLTPVLDLIAARTKQTPIQQAGLNHTLDDAYFKRIDAMEFAINFDDGKNPAGFLEADIVLLGVSRTSKTPLSLYLANEGYKVANLPLVPNTQIPKEIYQVDKNKLFGLTTDASMLQSIREERMKAYGLTTQTKYSSRANILKELGAANDLYHKLGCLVINTAHKSIEETATLIVESLKQK